jgi:hypothetical protein
MKYLFLTLNNSGEPVRVNFDNITGYFDSLTRDGGTLIFGQNYEEALYHVKETPEQIDEMLGIKPQPFVRRGPKRGK